MHLVVLIKAKLKQTRLLSLNKLTYTQTFFVFRLKYRHCSKWTWSHCSKWKGISWPMGI